MLVRIVKTAVAGLALASLAGGLLVARHPLLRLAASEAIGQELATARRGLR